MTVLHDPPDRKFVRIPSSEKMRDEDKSGVAYQIAHLSQPLLSTLPQGDGR